MNEKTRHFYSFGPFSLDARECLLILDGKPVPLAPKAFEALLMLVEDHGHLVDKDDLNEAALARYLSWRRPMLPSTSPY
jgi:DNA-binding winged helix-turn-helix (wHTH) protein